MFQGWHLPLKSSPPLHSLTPSHITVGLPGLPVLHKHSHSLVRMALAGHVLVHRAENNTNFSLSIAMSGLGEIESGKIYALDGMQCSMTLRLL